jgi:hypothetical protein
MGAATLATDSGRTVMGDREEFLDWVETRLTPAEIALHNGNAAPRRASWSRRDPVTIFGAWQDVNGQEELDDLFAALEASFSNCTSYSQELLAKLHGDSGGACSTPSG